MRVLDRVAAALITLGGLGTIVAVCLVCLFLVWVAAPLFLPSRERSAAGSAHLAPGSSETSGSAGPAWTAPPAALGVDDALLLGWALHDDGRVDLVNLRDGAILSESRPFGDAAPTASFLSLDARRAAFGFADGSIRLVEFDVKSTYPEDDAAPEAARALGPDEFARVGEAMFVRLPEGALRRESFSLVAGDPIPAPRLSDDATTPTAIRRIAASTAGDDPVVAALDEAGGLRLLRLERKKNLMTGAVSYKKKEQAIDWRTPEPSDNAEDRPAKSSSDADIDSAPGSPPDDLLLTGLGDQILLLWRTGAMLRIDARDPAKAAVAETVDLFTAAERGSREGSAESGSASGGAPLEITAATFLIGGSTLLVGDSRGGLHAWFGIKPEGADTPDGVRFVRAHDLAGNGSPVTALAASPRSRLAASGHADGSIRLHHATTARTVLDLAPDPAAPIRSLAIAPKEDAIVALPGALGEGDAARAGFTRRGIALRHPEATLAAFFRPVWYEGYVEPAHVWQSTGGSDAFEPKYGMAPLVFGTIKATLFSMIFGAPLALLAAIYTSEFLHPRTRARVKPAIELMASLPSVVLGFLAALVVAPFVERHLPTLVASLFTIPFCVLLGAHFWQLLPRRRMLTLSHRRILAAAAAILLGAVAARVLGAPLERALFAGDVFLWLDGRGGRAAGGWLVLLTPPLAALAAYLVGRHVSPELRRRAARWSPRRAAVVDLLKFLCATLATLLAAGGLGVALDLAGLDPRGGIVGTYTQRNALVVGFLMGFAIIPIIYTIAEDALSTVPDHLRSASLAAGATPWQTAILVVFPTALGGLFSALMIGLGRAVGETMIVLMAAGNTPVMEWNAFNGFRTLSANLAVELPEAVRDSTHYRTLFLAALVLFAMTFVLNTFAEAVRRRFRKRMYQL